MAAIWLLASVFITVSGECYSEKRPDPEEMDRQSKRKKQNLEAARKSYENKKEERRKLKETNTELMETQMRLLHDKSKLEDVIGVYEAIANHIKHSCDKDHIPEPRRQYNFTRAGRCADPPMIIDNDSGFDEPLDMRKKVTTDKSPGEASKTGQCMETRKSLGQVDTRDNNSYQKDENTPFVEEDTPDEDKPLMIVENVSGISEDHLDVQEEVVDDSMLTLGATQEVDQKCTGQRKCDHQKEIFIPVTTPKKRRHREFTAQSCAAAALKTDSKLQRHDSFSSC